MQTRKSTDIEFEFGGNIVPEIASTYSGVCMVIGGGKDMWSDLDKANTLCKSADRMCVNFSAAHVPQRVDHLFSYHRNVIGHIKAIRMDEFPDDKSIVHCMSEGYRVDHIWGIQPRSSFSGLLAAQICLLLGYRRIILCGVPMDDSGYFYLNHTTASLGDEQRLVEIKNAYNWGKGMIRSFSGRTKEILGEPDKEWLGGEYVS